MIDGIELLIAGYRYNYLSIKASRVGLSPQQERFKHFGRILNYKYC